MNKRLDRSVMFNQEVVGLKLPEYGWVRALVLDEVEGKNCMDTYKVKEPGCLANNSTRVTPTY